MKKAIVLIVLLTGFALSSVGINRLRVGDPRTSWTTYQGTIETALLAIRPKGLYREYSLYLTFSSRGTSYTWRDTLEVTYNFDLPDKSFVTDSWLWIGNNISRAKILDVWKATAIYEGIVKRRQDPSILTKLSNTSYQLKVFPMAGNQVRKVKITYLVPVTWSAEKVISKIPLELLGVSYRQVASLKVITWPDSVWQQPGITDYPEIAFLPQSDSTFGNYFYSEIPYSYFSLPLHLSYDTPKKKGVFFSTYKNNGENYYQLGLLPSVLVDSVKNKKIAILLDYDANYTNLDKTYIITRLKSVFKSKLTPKDSFNLIVSGLNITRISQTWIPADQTSIELAFNYATGYLSNYSNLPTLISNGVDFVKSHGGDGKILLITDNGQFGNPNVANGLVNDIVGSMDPDIPIYIADYQSKSYSTNYINGRNYYGNEYLYRNLSQITMGAYFSYRYNSTVFDDIVSMNLSEIFGSINTFEMYSSAAAGFCYGRYNLVNFSSVVSINQPILQTGRFYGTFPFSIVCSGVYNNQIISKSILLDSSDVFVADSSISAAWTGLYINDLESQSQTNNIIDNIITVSVRERVLSRYTAFLCLEDTSYYCDDCEDESILNISAESADEDTLLNVYPNPFTDRFTVSMKLSHSVNPEDVPVRLFDMQGRLVANLQPEINGDKLTCRFGPEIIELMPNGLYFVVITDGRDQKTCKITKLK